MRPVTAGGTAPYSGLSRQMEGARTEIPASKGKGLAAREEQRLIPALRGHSRSRLSFAFVRPFDIRVSLPGYSGRYFPSALPNDSAVRWQLVSVPAAESRTQNDFT